MEGILTVVVAIIAFFTLYDFPETATFLTEEERAFVVYRLKYQGHKEETDGGVRVAQDDSFQWKFVKAAFLDWQIWTNILVYWGKCSSLACAAFVALELTIIRYCMSSLWHIPLPSLHHSRAGLQFLDRSTSHCTHLHNRLGACCGRGLV